MQKRKWVKEPSSLFARQVAKKRDFATRTRKIVKVRKFIVPRMLFSIFKIRVSNFSLFPDFNMVPPIFLDITELNGKSLLKRIECCPDTGASITAFPSSLFHKKTLRKAKRIFMASDSFYSKVVTGADGKNIAVEGTLPAYLLAKNKKNEIKNTKTNIYICPEVTEPLISFLDLQRLGVVQKDFPLFKMKLQEDKKEDQDEKKKKKEATPPLTSLEDVLAKYSDVFDDSDKLEPMDFPPAKLELDKSEKIIPFHVATARQYPAHLKEAALKELARLERLGIIERVTKPTSWCSPSFFLPKKNNEVRLITDLSKLSRHIRRPVHPFNTVMETIQKIKPNMKWFATLDARQGFFQIQLDKDSQELTTFMTPHGRYLFLRLPMGMSSSMDVWCLASDQALEGIENCLKCVDDILLCGETKADLLRTLDEVLKRCSAKKLKINREKIQFGQEVNFGGYIISKDGAKPDPKKLAAIKDFPQPKNLTDLRSFLGLATQLALGSVPDLAHATGPLRSLLKKDVAYQWTDVQEKAFNKVKEILLSPRIVGFYDPKKQIILYTDASRLYGLGYAMCQEKDDGSLTLIQCGSRSLVDCETRYAVTELELLGVYFGVNACKHYMLHAPDVLIYVDHKALPPIFQKDLNQIVNGRILRLREKLLPYKFECRWVSGASHKLADALSRQACFAPTETEQKEADELNVSNYSLNVIAEHVYNVSNKIKDPIWEKLIKSTLSSKSYSRLKNMLETNQPKKNLPKSDPFRPIYDKLSTNNGFVLFGDRLVVPKDSQKDILEELHKGHIGQKKTLALAKQNYFWPNMNNDVKQMILGCKACSYFLPSPPVDQENANEFKATAPMDILGMDIFFAEGSEYLLVVDDYSSYFWTFKMKSIASEQIIACLEKLQHQYGYMKVAVSDGASNFTSMQFQNYCFENNIYHKKSSPMNPRSNMLSESGVRRCKHLLLKTKMKNENFEIQLMHFFNAPISETEKSPAELFFGRKFRIPHKPLSPFQFHLPTKEVFRKNKFEVGDIVLVQNHKTKRWDETGEIREIRRSQKSYYIYLFNSQNIVLRNEMYLRRYLQTKAIHEKCNCAKKSLATKKR